MSQTFDFIKTNLNAISNTGSAFLSLTEYMDVAIEKFQKIISGDTHISYVTIPVSVTRNGITKQVVSVVQSSDLKDALNGDIDTVNCIIDNQLQTVSVSADQLQESFEDQVTDFQIQSEFIKTCLSSETVSSESFVSAVKAKFSGISTVKLQQYAELLHTNDKLGALKSWVSQVKCNKVVEADGNIEMVDRTKYTGVSVWSVVIDDFFTTISGFFDKLWRGIQDIGGFFERLWNGLVKLGKYILYKAFNYLSTNLTNGDSKIGVLDFPILQVDLGTIPVLTITDEISRLDDENFRLRFSGTFPDSQAANFKLYTKFAKSLNRVQRNYSNLYFYGGHQLKPHPSQLDTESQRFSNLLMKIVANDLLVIQRDPELYDETTGVNRITAYSWKAVDVQIPNAYDLLSDYLDGYVMRLGVTSDNKLVLSLYVSTKQSVKEGHTDADIYKAIYTYTRMNFLVYMYSDLHLPITTDYSGTSNPVENKVLEPYYWFQEAFMTDLSSQEESSDGPIDFASHIKKLSSDDFKFENTISDAHYNLCYDDGLMWFIYHGLMAYYTIFGPISDSNYISDVINDHRYLKSYAQQACCWDSSYWVDGNYIYENLELPLNWDSEYKPYLSYSLTPSCLHLQTLSEQAKEIEWTIIGALIAVAAIALTIIATKFKRKLRVDTEIARGQCDNKAWTMDPSNPTDRREYLSLRKKARKKERLSRLFGVTSNLAVESASSNLSDMIAGVSSGGSESIIKLIKGE